MALVLNLETYEATEVGGSEMSTGDDATPHEVLLIGRGDDCVIRFLNGTVSAHHAHLIRRGQNCVLVDLASTNGTFVNQVRISEKVLHEGDEVYFGLCRTVYQEGVFVETAK